MKPLAAAQPAKSPRHGVARTISKLGLGSRTQAEQWVREGRVCVNGARVHDPEFPVRGDLDTVTVDGLKAVSTQRLVLMLNKPRGLVTTTKDERGRQTVYSCFAKSALPWVAPVGRLDKASEGLLLFSNDPAWAARITDSAAGPDKTYHVQINHTGGADFLEALEHGAVVDGERLTVKSARCLRSGTKNAWLEIILNEGRNRHIRRLLASFDVSVLRLVRTAVGRVLLGKLPKGEWRRLTEQEIESL